MEQSNLCLISSSAVLQYSQLREDAENHESSANNLSLNTAIKLQKQNAQNGLHSHVIQLYAVRNEASSCKLKKDYASVCVSASPSNDVSTDKKW
ncbi:hypothetical protein D918_02807 [Trichuris suis]|nr:hypothetical protein D918_02807 [Trichuris suis]